MSLVSKKVQVKGMYSDCLIWEEDHLYNENNHSLCLHFNYVRTQTIGYVHFAFSLINRFK